MSATLQAKTTSLEPEAAFWILCADSDGLGNAIDRAACRALDFVMRDLPACDLFRKVLDGFLTKRRERMSCAYSSSRDALSFARRARFERNDFVSVKS